MTSSPWARKQLVVAGGNGFVGSWFVHRLLSEGARVVSLQRTRRLSRLPMSDASRHNLTSVSVDLVDLDDVVRQVGGTVAGSVAMICCAGLDGNARFKLTRSGTLLDENVRVVSSVLRLAREWNIPDVVLMSSAEVYSGHCGSPMAESCPYCGWDEPGANGYVLSKVYSEVLGFAFGRQHGIRVYCPRPTNLYGPGDRTTRTRARVISSMISRARNGQDIEIWGDGRERRAFMHVEDMVRAVLAILRHGVVGPINVGTHEEVSIGDLADLVLGMFGGTGRVQLQGVATRSPRARTLDLTKLASVMDFEPRSLRQGLTEMRAFLNERRSG